MNTEHLYIQQYGRSGLNCMALHLYLWFFYIDPQRPSALSIPVAVALRFCCGFFLQVKFDIWKQGIMDVPQDGCSGSSSQLSPSLPPQGDASHMLISIHNGPVKSSVETGGREQLVLPREIREDFP